MTDTDFQVKALAAWNRIAAALEALAPLPEPPPEPEPTGCPHPAEATVSLGMTDGRQHWECTQCRTQWLT